MILTSPYFQVNAPSVVTTLSVTGPSCQVLISKYTAAPTPEKGLICAVSEIARKNSLTAEISRTTCLSTTTAIGKKSS